MGSIGVDAGQETKSFYRASRLFNELCIPALYREISFMGDTHHMTFLRTHPIFTVYPAHIRTIRAEISQSIYHEDYESLLLDTIDRCNNAKTLVLYYSGRPMGVDSSLQIAFTSEIVMRLERGSYSSIGVYQSLLYRSSHGRVKLGSGLWDFVNSITESKVLTNRIRILDLMVAELPKEIYDHLRSNMTNLTALTLRRCVEGDSGKIWDPSTGIIWKPYQHLTKLQLISCIGAEAEQIPSLVREFASLRYLLISGCGHPRYQPKTMSRERGWSQSTDSLSRCHRPLDLIRIEQMWHWEIWELGIIPVLELSIAATPIEEVVKIFIDDEELFPGLETLHVTVEASGARKVASNDFFIMATRSQESYTKLSVVCEERNITLLKDARWIAYSPKTL